MKTFALVLSIFCLVGCAGHQSATPKTNENTGRGGEDPKLVWPSVESNFTAIVVVEYQILDTINNQSRSIDVIGLVVGPQAVISNDVPSTFHNLIVQKIMVRPFGDQHSVVASIVTRRDGANITLLKTSEPLRAMPVVFRNNTNSVGDNGYRISFGSKKIGEIIPVTLVFSSDSHDCVAFDLEDIDPSYGPWIVFDTKHRLICYDWLKSEEWVRFLRDNGVEVVTK